MESHAALLRLLYRSDAGFDRYDCAGVLDPQLCRHACCSRRHGAAAVTAASRAFPPGCSKLNAAERLLVLLLHPDETAALGVNLPSLVQGHYVRSLLDWACGVLTKTSDPAGGEAGKHKAKKRRANDGQARYQQPAAHPRLQRRGWAVLQALLASASVAPSQPLPAALLPAATAVLEAVQQLSEMEEAEGLLVQVAALLQLLGSKFKASFRPGIEQATGAAQAALNGHAAAGDAAQQQVWASVAVAAADLLQAAAAGHPNQRKVWDAALPRLLPLLAQGAFPVAASPSSSELVGCCTRLLASVVFNQQHVAGLAAAAALEMAAASADGATAAPSEEAQAAGQSVRASYAGQLFPAIAQQVAGGQLPYALLPWMVGQFCAALRQHRDTADTGKLTDGRAVLAARCCWRTFRLPTVPSHPTLQRLRSPARRGCAARSSSLPWRPQQAAASAFLRTSISGWLSCARCSRR